MVIERITFVVTQADGMNDGVGKVDRDEVERVHQNDPEEYRQGERGDELARGFVVDDTARLLIDHIDEHFDRALEPAGNARGRTARSHPHQEHRQQTHGGRPEHRVVIEYVKINDERLLSTDAVGMDQMVLDIFSLGRYTTFSRHM